MNEENISFLAKEVKKEKTALTGAEIENFAKKKGWSNFKVIDLETLNKLSTEELFDLNIYLIIYTGDTPNEYSPNSHHWLAISLDVFFDSYGHYKQYKLPITVQDLNTVPSQLQEYGSDVCGEYCLAFISMCYSIYENNKGQSSTYSAEELANLFTNIYGLGFDKLENDEKILKWYKDQI